MKPTKVTLIIYDNVWESETFENFTGIVPRVGEHVRFYKKMHDGCFYGGTVKKVEYRIEHATQNDNKKKTLQEVRVFLDDNYKEESMDD
jgi:hypothetical protein